MDLSQDRVRNDYVKEPEGSAQLTQEFEGGIDHEAESSSVVTQVVISLTFAFVSR
jgi:hypothetical protein